MLDLVKWIIQFALVLGPDTNDLPRSLMTHTRPNWRDKYAGPPKTHFTKMDVFTAGAKLAAAALFDRGQLGRVVYY